MYKIRELVTAIQNIRSGDYWVVCEKTHDFCNQTLEKSKNVWYHIEDKACLKKKSLDISKYGNIE